MRYTFVFLLAGISISLFAQKKELKMINQSVNKTEIEAQLAFLAADEMRGRNTGSPEIDIAANYIASHFKTLGVKPPSGTSTYFQELDGLEKIYLATGAQLSIGADAFQLKEDLVVLMGAGIDIEKEVVFVGYGSEQDFKNTPVKDKIVFAFAGTPETKSPGAILSRDSPRKRKLAVENGAVALVEIMAIPGVPWPMLTNYTNSNRISMGQGEPADFCHLLLKNSEKPSIKALVETKAGTATLRVQSRPAQSVAAKNVVGVIGGTDASLKNEWIAITAHYDHVGVKKNNSLDSIFNGARDDATGVVALLQTAKFLSANKPKRSVVLIAFTAEEIGLVGSKWYAEHPLIPLNQTVFDFNCDGAGYNDKTIATVIDLNRTTTDENIRSACAAFGLTLQGDPAKEQNLFERSDNFNFAAKGVPATNFSPGVRAFDQELFKYYHQPTDEVASLDMDYMEKFFRAFVYASHLISNAKERPTWVKGDKFEEAGKTLYSK